jgi:hypothetical protein
MRISDLLPKQSPTDQAQEKVARWPEIQMPVRENYEALSLLNLRCYGGSKYMQAPQAQEAKLLMDLFDAINT